MRLPLLGSVVLLGSLLAGCAAPRQPITPATAGATAVDWAQARRVDVILDSFEFAPERLTFARGQPYRLHLENKADGGHNFDAPAFFRSVALRPDATSAKIAAAGGALELRANEAADVYFVASRAGAYPLECSHTFHAAFGMTGEIVVK